jgi:hypothetical protein
VGRVDGKFAPEQRAVARAEVAGDLLALRTGIRPQRQIGAAIGAARNDGLGAVPRRRVVTIEAKVQERLVPVMGDGRHWNLRKGLGQRPRATPRPRRRACRPLVDSESPRDLPSGDKPPTLARQFVRGCEDRAGRAAAWLRAKRVAIAAGKTRLASQFMTQPE